MAFRRFSFGSSLARYRKPGPIRSNFAIMEDSRKELSWGSPGIGTLWPGIRRRCSQVQETSYEKEDAVAGGVGHAGSRPGNGSGG